MICCDRGKINISVEDGSELYADILTIVHWAMVNVLADVCEQKGTDMSTELATMLLPALELYERENKDKGEY